MTRSTTADPDPRDRPDPGQGQAPFAIVLGCADSRVTPERIFDQAVGDLFVARVAGNVADASVVGSIEFGVGVLGAPLVVVLGHEQCGAVTAALEEIDDPSVVRSEALGAVTAPIRAHLEAAIAAGDDHATLSHETAVAENVRGTVRELANHPGLLSERIAAGTLSIVGAVYSIETGSVTFLDE